MFAFVFVFPFVSEQILNLFLWNINAQKTCYQILLISFPIQPHPLSISKGIQAPKHQKDMTRKFLFSLCPWQWVNPIALYICLLHRPINITMGQISTTLHVWQSDNGLLYSLEIIFAYSPSWKPGLIVRHVNTCENLACTYVLNKKFRDLYFYPAPPLKQTKIVLVNTINWNTSKK